ncbi:MAG: hypothetical protein LBR33_02150 [Propionibacteriaceae bacterium]|nr:hypothetical protein [Propionibacteriaceae bacterium]
MATFIRKSRPEPLGAERLTLGYLAVLLCLFGAAIVAGIAYPIVGATGVCVDDPTEGLCYPFTVGLAAVPAFFLLLVGAGWVFALGAAWAGWIILLDLVTFEAIVGTNQLWLAALLLVTPAVAAVLTIPRRPDPLGQYDPPSRALGYAKLAVASLLLIQFLVLAVPFVVTSV